MHFGPECNLTFGYRFSKCIYFSGLTWLSWCYQADKTRHIFICCKAIMQQTIQKFRKKGIQHIETLQNHVTQHCAYSMWQGFDIIYEGHPINKLLNGIILLIFKIWKIWDIRFVGNLFLSISCKFHYIDVIIMTSLKFWTQSVSAFLPTGIVFTHRYSFTTRECYTALQVTRKGTSSTSRPFKTSNSNVCFSTYLPYSFKHLSKLSHQHSAWENQLLQSFHWSSKQRGGQVVSSQ